MRTGALRLFRNHELTPEAVMASACLPLIFQRSKSTARPLVLVILLGSAFGSF